MTAMLSALLALYKNAPDLFRQMQKTGGVDLTLVEEMVREILASRKAEVESLNFLERLEAELDSGEKTPVYARIYSRDCDLVERVSFHKFDSIVDFIIARRHEYEGAEGPVSVDEITLEEYNARRGEGVRDIAAELAGY